MLKILARVLDLELKDKLIEAGANWVVVETLESSLHIGAEALKVLGVADEQVSELVDSLRKDESMAAQSEVENADPVEDTADIHPDDFTEHKPAIV